MSRVRLRLRGGRHLPDVQRGDGVRRGGGYQRVARSSPGNRGPARSVPTAIGESRHHNKLRIFVRSDKNTKFLLTRKPRSVPLGRMLFISLSFAYLPCMRCPTVYSRAFPVALSTPFFASRAYLHREVPVFPAYAVKVEKGKMDRSGRGRESEREIRVRTQMGMGCPVADLPARSGRGQAGL